MEEFYFEKIINILFKNEKLNISQNTLEKVDNCYNFLKEFVFPATLLRLQESLQYPYS